MVVVGLTVGVEGVPDRDRHAEEALAGDEPVAVQAGDPVGVARSHEGGVEVDLAAAGDEGGIEVGVAAAVADVPLPRGDDLEWLLTALVEVGLALGRGGLAVEVAGLPQGGDDGLTGTEGGLPGQPTGIQVGTGGVGQPRGQLPLEATRTGHDRAGGQAQLAPPDHVGEVAEGAAHRDAGTLVHLGAAVGQHRHLDVEERGAHGGAEERLVALVVGVGDERDTARDELGSGRLDVHRAVGAVEGDPVVVPGVVPRLQLGLCHGGLERDVPQPGGLGLVGLAAREVAQEGLLGGGAGVVIDGAVGDRPVVAVPDPAEEGLEGLLVLDGQLIAQLDEVLPADRHLVGRLGALGITTKRRLEVGVVVEGRVAAHAVVVLDPLLGGQPVVVPADRVEDVEPLHALVAGHAVGVGVAEDVTHVQRATGRGGWGVDGEHLGPGACQRSLAIEGVGVLLLPHRGPLVLQALEGGPVRDGGSGG